MDRYFVDTNVFLRFLTNDVPAQADKAEQLLLRAARDEIALETNALVIAEIVWTLSSYYGRHRDDIKSDVLAILNTHGLTVDDADLVGEAAVLYAAANIEFVDAYSALWMKRRGLSRALTFDARHFARTTGVVPVIPA